MIERQWIIESTLLSVSQIRYHILAYSHTPPCLVPLNSHYMWHVTGYAQSTCAKQNHSFLRHIVLEISLIGIKSRYIIKYFKL